MTIAAAVAIAAAPASRPAVVALLIGLAAWWTWRRSAWWWRPPRPVEIGQERPPPDPRRGLEPPAVVGLLTSGYQVPDVSVVATTLDLARRGWIRLAMTEDGEVVVFTRGRGRHGDALRPFEQQVLNHLTARSFDGLTTGGALATGIGRLNRRWWRRYRRDVVRAARERGLSRRRYTPVRLALPAALSLIGVWVLRSADAAGDPDRTIASSILPRSVWWAGAVLIAVAAVGSLQRAVAPLETPTELGERRAGRWLGYRARLAARIPERASVVAPGDQQLALAYAIVMGLNDDVLDQLPVVREDLRLAWSEAGGTPHVVSVRYPLRPGYGRNPYLVVLVGGIVALAGRWTQGFARRVRDGEALPVIVETFPDRAELVERIAGGIGLAMWVPIVWGLWVALAGAIDSVVSRQRIGAVVRARRPAEVVPGVRLLRAIAERDRFSVFVAVDDGRRRSVTAWRANERTAVPQGAYARVRATLLLGHVRSSEPVGTSVPRTVSSP